MKIDVTCALVRDLLPLYADGVLSGDGNHLVETHLPECPPCAEELKALSKPVPVKERSARKSLKKSKRRLSLGIASAVLAVALLLAGGLLIGSKDAPVPYFDGMFEKIFVFKATADGPMGEGDFIRIQLARNPMFEYNGIGEATAEDVILETGPGGERVRVGVLYVQNYKSPRDIFFSRLRARFHNGRNPMIAAYGMSAIKTAPKTEQELAEFCAWETEAAGVPCTYDHKATVFWGRDVPITKVYYYDGPTRNLLDGDQSEGWSQRSGVYENSVLLMDDVVEPGEAGERWRLYWQSDPEGTTGPHTFVQSAE